MGIECWVGISPSSLDTEVVVDELSSRLFLFGDSDEAFELLGAVFKGDCWNKSASMFSSLDSDAIVERASDVLFLPDRSGVAGVVKLDCRAKPTGISSSFDTSIEVSSLCFWLGELNDTSDSCPSGCDSTDAALRFCNEVWAGDELRIVVQRRDL